MSNQNLLVCGVAGAAGAEEDPSTAQTAHPAAADRPATLIQPLDGGGCAPAGRVRRRNLIFDPSGLPLRMTPDSHEKVLELRELMQWSEGQVWCIRPSVTAQ